MWLALSQSGEKENQKKKKKTFQARAATLRPSAAYVITRGKSLAQVCTLQLFCFLFGFCFLFSFRSLGRLVDP
jgi:hypothetical protein